MLQVNLDQLRGHDGDAYRDIPWGRVDRGEDIDNVLTREVLEETWFSDIVIIRELWTAVSPMRIPVWETDFGLILSIYHVKHKGLSEVILSDEHIAYEWCDLSTVLKRLEVKYSSDLILKIWYIFDI